MSAEEVIFSFKRKFFWSWKWKNGILRPYSHPAYPISYSPPHPSLPIRIPNDLSSKLTWQPNTHHLHQYPNYQQFTEPSLHLHYFLYSLFPRIHCLLFISTNETENPPQYQNYIIGFVAQAHTKAFGKFDIESHQFSSKKFYVVFLTSNKLWFGNSKREKYSIFFKIRKTFWVIWLWGEGSS